MASNAGERVTGSPLYRRFLGSFTHFFAMVLWVAAGIALAAEYGQPGQGMATLSCAIVGVIVVNGLFAFWQDFRADQTLNKLARLLPSQTTVLRGGSIQRQTFLKYYGRYRNRGFDAAALEPQNAARNGKPGAPPPRSKPSSWRSARRDAIATRSIPSC